MKLNSNSIKDVLLQSFKGIDPKTLKRKSKKKTANGIERVFVSNLGTIVITTNSEDTQVIEAKHNLPADKAQIPAVSKKFEDYFFAVDNVATKDEGPLCPSYLGIVLVKKKYWNKNKHSDGSYQKSVAKELERFNICSENDSSDFCSYDEKNKDKIIELLESMGMEYNNEIAEFYNAVGNNLFIKP